MRVIAERIVDVAIEELQRRVRCRHVLVEPREPGKRPAVVRPPVQELVGIRVEAVSGRIREIRLHDRARIQHLRDAEQEVDRVPAPVLRSIGRMNAVGGKPDAECVCTILVRRPGPSLEPRRARNVVALVRIRAGDADGVAVEVFRDLHVARGPIVGDAQTRCARQRVERER